MKREQLYLFQDYVWEEELDGIDGDELCEDEEIYEGELSEIGWESQQAG
jgi:hypothetical protein